MFRAGKRRSPAGWKRVARGGVSCTVAMAVMLCGSGAAVWAKSPLGKHWPANQQLSMNDIDHAPFNALLSKYVDDDGYVNYTAWKASSPDRQALRKYLRALSRGSTTRPASRQARLAFWINAYNAVTLEGILDVYPTSSIREHTATLFGYNIWTDLPLNVGEGTYSLEQIEHQNLRKLGEPRIHFAIVCASVGCPRLRNEAYTASRLEEQLADNARDFFSRRSNFRFDEQSKQFNVSSILKWFDSDFGQTQVDRFGYLKPYLPASARRAATDPNTNISFLDYDWSLNDQARRKRTRRTK